MIYKTTLVKRNITFYHFTHCVFLCNCLYKTNFYFSLQVHHRIRISVFRSVTVNLTNPFIPLYDCDFLCILANAINYIEMFKLAAETNPNDRISVSSNIMGKLKTANPDEMILLSPEAHKIKDGGVVVDSCVIKGVNQNEPAYVVSFTENIMFDCVGNSVMLENLTLDCQKAQCGLLVRKGHLIMKNCTLNGDLASTIRDGILVLKDAALTLEKCTFSGFSTAIVGNSGSSISIRGCTISEAMRGILIYSNCQLNIKSSCIESCKDYGIVVETEEELPFNESPEPSSRPFDDLKT